MLVQVLEHLRAPQLSETRFMQFISKFPQHNLRYHRIIANKGREAGDKKGYKRSKSDLFFFFSPEIHNGGPVILRA